MDRSRKPSKAEVYDSSPTIGMPRILKPVLGNRLQKWLPMVGRLFWGRGTPPSSGIYDDSSWRMIVPTRSPRSAPAKRSGSSPLMI